ncbi:MAG: M20/M25/M40 family metallo-hydrolase [Gemmatimonadetes bacterium]|nr:M20/M25/M40 family metallo-hydrolase [Gemmatimonadota bacterium]
MTEKSFAVGAQLLSNPVLREALDHLIECDERTLLTQVALTEVPAPPFGESARAASMVELFAEASLDSVSTDDEGNVLGALAGAHDEPPLILSAHLDTVFPEGTDVSVHMDGDTWYGPGISDDGRGLAALVAIARCMGELGIEPTLPILFAATVGEEGIGDLRGVKHLFAEHGVGRSARAFISLDGAGLSRVVVRGLGARRIRVTVRGPGGHSWADRGAPNAIHALGGAVAEIAAIDVPASPPSAVTVARWGGGTSINAIPAEAWFELDLRSESADVLRELEVAVLRIVDDAVDQESARIQDGAAGLELAVEVIGDRPAGCTDPDSHVVQAALAATRSIEVEPGLVAASTDANIPMSLGIPSVTLGAGGEAGRIHTTEEWYRNERGPEGIYRGLLTALLVTGIS